MATYLVAACMVVAISVGAWHYNQRIARLEEGITTLRKAHEASTEDMREVFVREFAAKLVDELTGKVPPQAAVLEGHDKESLQAAKLDTLAVLGYRPFEISHLCVKFIKFKDGMVSWPDDDARKFCKTGPLKFAHQQDDIVVATVRDDDGNTAYVTASKRTNHLTDWLVAVVSEPNVNDAVGSTEDIGNTFPHLPAWIHGATVLVSLGVGCFVIGSGRRLGRMTHRLSSMPSNLVEVRSRIHDCRNQLSAISWDGLHHPDIASARRLDDIENAVCRASDGLAIPDRLAQSNVGAAHWLRNKVAVWDGVGEFTDLAQLARRIAMEEETAAQVPVVVEIRDVIAQQISEYDAATLLRNMIGNAVKHGAPPLTVTVTRTVKYPHQKEPAAEVIVANDGTPYNATKTGTGGDTGSGQRHGLDIIRDLARKHGGVFEIDCGSTGRGAVARLTLPI